jgi:hypothetical protein
VEGGVEPNRSSVEQQFERRERFPGEEVVVFEPGIGRFAAGSADLAADEADAELGMTVAREACTFKPRPQPGVVGPRIPSRREGDTCQNAVRKHRRRGAIGSIRS